MSGIRLLAKSLPTLLETTILIHMPAADIQLKMEG